jgi:hypothetical protein
MIEALQEGLTRSKQIELVKPASKIYRLHSLETKLINCLTPDLARDIKTSMPTGISNKDGGIFFIKILSHTFPDREAHKRVSTIWRHFSENSVDSSNNMMRSKETNGKI